MFARLATIVLCVLPVFAVPTKYNGSSGDGSSGNCTTGEIMCCNNAQNVNPSGSATGLAGILTGLIGGLIVPIDVQCVPVTGIGANGISCAGQVACCSNDQTNALISLQCSPININA